MRHKENETTNRRRDVVRSDASTWRLCLGYEGEGIKVGRAMVEEGREGEREADDTTVVDRNKEAEREGGAGTMQMKACSANLSPKIRTQTRHEGEICKVADALCKRSSSTNSLSVGLIILCATGTALAMFPLFILRGAHTGATTTVAKTAPRSIRPFLFSFTWTVSPRHRRSSSRYLSSSFYLLSLFQH